VIDITEANRLLDEQRRVIQEVARRCFFKGNNHYLYCCPCPLWHECGVGNPNKHKEEEDHGNLG